MSVLAVECRGVAVTEPQKAVRYEIRDHLSVPPPPEGSLALVWHPIVQDSPYQRVLDLIVASPRSVGCHARPGPWERDAPCRDRRRR